MSWRSHGVQEVWIQLLQLVKDNTWYLVSEIIQLFKNSLFIKSSILTNKHKHVIVILWSQTEPLCWLMLALAESEITWSSLHFFSCSQHNKVEKNLSFKSIFWTLIYISFLLLIVMAINLKSVYQGSLATKLLQTHKIYFWQHLYLCSHQL